MSKKTDEPDDIGDPPIEKPTFSQPVDLAPLEKRVKYLENVLTTVLKSVQHLEKETGSSIMPEGEFFGVKF